MIETIDAVDIKKTVSPKDAARIFGKAPTAKKFLSECFNYEPKDLKKLKSDATYNLVVNNWDYEKALKFVRKEFLESEKGLRGKEGLFEMKKVISSWENKNGKKLLHWPFSEKNGFDRRVMSVLRSKKEDFIAKEKIIFDEVEEYLYMKEAMTARNDYIEYLIISNSENVMPTLSDSKHVDYFIDGKKYDQKVSSTVGDAFKNKYPENWKKVALEHPDWVAKSLYENQGNDRFNPDWRVYVVFLEDGAFEEKNIEDVVERLKDLDVNKPYDIQFKYTQEGETEQTYNTKCLCLLV